MTDDPIPLDGHRSAAERHRTEQRRRPANSPEPLGPQPGLDRLDHHMRAGPARTWAEVLEKWRFLLERYATTPEAREERLQKLIQRALGDMERLRKREERT
ncbi:MAG: hypothetical protein KDK09_01050 [Rhodobacteraceae bacterium]|nr:hypothetical protein [Paracoccaceae bacterium]